MNSTMRIADSELWILIYNLRNPPIRNVHREPTLPSEIRLASN